MTAGTDRRLVAGVPTFTRWWRAGVAGRPPVVLVHGLALSGRYLVPTAERLAAAGVGDVYAPDLPGFGRSGPPRGAPDRVVGDGAALHGAALDVPGLAGALEAWLDARGLPAAVLVGHSLGAEVVAELAARAPARAAAVVLASPTVDPAHRHALVQVARLAWDAPRERPALVLLAAAAYARAGPGRAVATLRAAIAYRLEEAVPRIVAPVQVIWGTRDPLVSARWAARLAALAGRPSVAIEGAPHGMPFSAADDFAAALVRAVDALGAARRRPRVRARVRSST